MHIFLTIHPNQLVKYVGKYLNTIFLVLLAIIFLLATFYPIRGLGFLSIQSINKWYFRRI
ncbi:branched-chain amino acid transport system II carrier protein [Enterococcus faecalis]|uniref:branched-chain amino acid transport system II carrier protein n=1 Tax=Enterococcus faecalis TaxID=1351 RepID=UPI0034E54608